MENSVLQQPNNQKQIYIADPIAKIVEQNKQIHSFNVLLDNRRYIWECLLRFEVDAGKLFVVRSS